MHLPPWGISLLIPTKLLHAMQQQSRWTISAAQNSKPLTCDGGILHYIGLQETQSPPYKPSRPDHFPASFAARVKDNDQSDAHFLDCELGTGNWRCSRKGLEKLLEQQQVPVYKTAEAGVVGAVRNTHHRVSQCKRGCLRLATGSVRGFGCCPGCCNHPPLCSLFPSLIL